MLLLLILLPASSIQPRLGSGSCFLTTFQEWGRHTQGSLQLTAAAHTQGIPAEGCLQGAASSGGSAGMPCCCHNNRPADGIRRWLLSAGVSHCITTRHAPASLMLDQATLRMACSLFLASDWSKWAGLGPPHLLSQPCKGQSGQQAASYLWCLGWGRHDLHLPATSASLACL